MLKVSVIIVTILLMLGFFWVSDLHAQETAGAPVTGSYRADGLGLRKDVDALKQRITSVTTQLMEIKSCHEQGKIYAPQAGGTVNKCIDFIVEAASVTPVVSLTRPDGSWVHSCMNISVVNNTMTTDCRARNGEYEPNTVDLRTCRGADNNNGVLVCRNYQLP